MNNCQKMKVTISQTSKYQITWFDSHPNETSRVRSDWKCWPLSFSRRPLLYLEWRLVEKTIRADRNISYWMFPRFAHLLNFPIPRNESAAKNSILVPEVPLRISSNWLRAVQPMQVFAKEHAIRGWSSSRTSDPFHAPPLMLRVDLRMLLRRPALGSRPNQRLQNRERLFDSYCSRIDAASTLSEA